MIHRAELVQIQQLGQLASIDAVVLVPDFQQGILARIADHHSGDVRLEQIVQPGRPGSFFKGYVQAATQATNELENRLGFRFENRLHHQISARIPNGHRDRCLMDIHPNILGVIHEGAPCCRLRCDNQNLLQAGALL